MRAQLAVPDNTLVERRHLQPALHHARHGDDVPVRGAGRGGGGRLPAARHAGRARPALSAAVGLRLLGLRDRRPGLLLHDLLRRRRPTAAGSCTRRSPARSISPGIGADWWLLGIGFIEISAIAGAIELIIGILFTRAPGMTLMQDAGVRLGHAGDGADDRVRLPGDHRRHHAAGAGARLRLALLHRRRAAATRCCGSTCSGSSAIRRSTSSSCPPRAWCR